MRTLGWVALAAVIVQGLFGGLTVRLRLPPAVSIIHASLAQAFFCITVSIAVFTSPWWFRDVSSVDDSASPRLASVSLWLAAAAFLQLVLGAAFRHNAFGIWPHLVGAAVVLALAVVVARTVRRHFAAVAPLRGLSKWLNAVIGAQILLGGAAWWSRIATREAPQPELFAIWLTVAHVVLGAVVLASTVVFVLVCHRLLRASAGQPVLAGHQHGQESAVANRGV
jgi:cytochrome c oxidase assembly protein subunit 15